MVTAVAALIWFLSFLIGSIFSFIAGVFRNKTPKVKFMQIRLEGLITLLLTPLWIITVFKVISLNGFSSDTGGSYKFIKEYVWNWGGLFWFIGYSCAGFFLKLGIYKVWFTDFASLSNEDRKKLLAKYEES